ncbi:transmembrane protein [Cryptosporidium ryanae]|uniref:uncharacterized protein n=1 Tax=Cryptosporidium ryanae TaxID=515981 RepID=UPI00351A067F|nr:transmembrane protein [Cryptosporidium ryanae]
MEVNNAEEKDVLAAVRTPSLSTVSPPSNRYFDARSWEENRDILSLRIQSPVSELYLDGEFSPTTVIGSPDSIVDIRTPEAALNETNGVQGEKLETDVNFCYKLENQNQNKTNNENFDNILPFSKRLTYVILSILLGFVFIVAIIGAFFYLGTYTNWDYALFQGLEFDVDNININFIPDNGFEKMETSVMVRINAPLKNKSLYKNSNIHLDFKNSEIEWNSLPIAKINSPDSLDIFESDKIDVIIETTSNATNVQGISGIIQDIFTKGMAQVSINANIDNPNYLSKRNLELVTRKFIISMPLRKLMTNIQLTDIKLDRETDYNSNIVFQSKMSYEYRGRIFIRNLGKIFFGVFHGINYLGVLKIEDSAILSGEKTDLDIYGTLNMHNFINDKKLVNTLMPSIDFGENTSHNIPIRTINLDIQGVGSSSTLLDSAVRSAKSNINLAVLPPPPLRQIPTPSISINSLVIFQDNKIRITGVLKTTFYGYLISNNDIPKIETLHIEGILDRGGQFKISSLADNEIENIVSNEQNNEIVSSESIVDDIGNNDVKVEEELIQDQLEENYAEGVPYNTVTISPYTDKYDININMEIVFEDASDISTLNLKNNVLFANNIKIFAKWSFFTGFHYNKRIIEKTQFELEMFNFIPKLLNFVIEENTLQAEISLRLLYIEDTDSINNVSYTGPIKISWYCDSEFVSNYVLREITVNHKAKNYLLKSANLIPEKCNLGNSDIKVEIYSS